MCLCQDRERVFQQAQKRRGLSTRELPPADITTRFTVLKLVRCDACRERKVKCSGSHPCRFCSRRCLECVFRENRKRKLYSVEYAAPFTVITAQADETCRYVKSLESKLEASIAATQSPGVPSQLPRRTSTPECAPYDTEVMDASASPAALNGTVDENLGSSQNEIDFDHAFPLPSPRPDVQLEARDSGLTGQVTDSSHPRQHLASIPIYMSGTVSANIFMKPFLPILHYPPVSILDVKSKQCPERRGPLQIPLITKSQRAQIMRTDFNSNHHDPVGSLKVSCGPARVMLKICYPLS